MTDNAEIKYTEASLCFPIRGDEVLLARKQKKIGAGFLNGFGGKKDPEDIDIYATNIREAREEIGIDITSAKKFGEIVFNNPSSDDELKHMRVHIFLVDKWSNDPTETEEMKSISWHKINSLDYSQFLAADRLFIPQILGRKCIKGLISYNEDWSIKSADIEEVSGFENN